MKKIFLLLNFIFAVINVYAQYPQFMLKNGNFFEYRRNQISNNELKRYQKLFGDQYKRNYDVLSYDLKLDWTEALSSEPMKYSFSGKNNITLVFTEPSVNQIELDARNLDINKIILNNRETINYNYNNDILKINLDNSYQLGDTLSVIIDYKFTGRDTVGFYLFPKNMAVGYGPTGEMVYTEERIAYTMSEPEDARYWMPCNDRPNDKARSSIKIKVPKDYIAVSNGLLVSKTEDNETITYHWADTALISTYLMAVAASKFVSYNEWYKDPRNPNDSIELVYYVWEKDLENEKTDWTVYNAKNAFKPTSFIIDLYSQKYILYPFRKYGQVAIQPFYFGGMEHQTITFVNRSWLRGRSQSGIAHELAHHWIGNLVTCEDWQNIWFNEGGATWSEAIWTEGWGGYQWYLEYMNSVGDQYRDRKSLMKFPIYNIPTNYIFSYPYSLLVYNKASWIYHQLRIMLGDEVFFVALRKLLIKYAFSNINLEKFQQHFEEEVPKPPIPFNIFFNQWLKTGGHPIYNISAQTYFDKMKNKYITNINVKQTQTGENVNPLFVTYLPIVLFNSDNIVENFVINNQPEQSFTLETEFIPDSIFIDTRKVLAESNRAKVNFLTSINEKNSQFISVFPTITNPNSYIDINFNKFGNNSIIQLYNSLGELVQEFQNQNEVFNLYIGNLTVGVYYLRIYCDNKIFSQKIIIQ